MFWPTTVHAAALVASAALSMWAAIIARTRRGVPGGPAFGWMMLAVALWSFTSAIHTLIDDRESRVVIAKFQYLGVAPIGVLWLLFTSRIQPAGVDARPAAALRRSGLCRSSRSSSPSRTSSTTFTGRRSRKYRRRRGHASIYRGGSWYWVHAGYSYLLILLGTLTLVGGLRRFPPPYRRQTALIIIGALVPWAGNLLYLTGALPAGLDAHAARVHGVGCVLYLGHLSPPPVRPRARRARHGGRQHGRRRARARRAAPHRRSECARPSVTPASP